MNAVAAGPDETAARALEAIVARLPDGEGLRFRRGERLRRFLERGWPTTRDETWRFCDLHPMRGIAFSHEPAATADVAAAEGADSLLAADGVDRLTFVNGRLAGAPTGGGEVRLRSLADALAADGARVRERLGAIERAEDHPFTDLNAALWADGAHVVVPRGARPDRPVHLLFVSVGAEPLAVHPRVLVEVEDGAHAVLVEEYVTLDGAAVFHDPVAEIAVGDGASLVHTRLLRERPDHFHIGSITARLARDARCRVNLVALGGRISRTDVHLHFAGEGAEGRLNGLYAAAGGDLADIHTWFDHAVPRTTSDQLVKGVLNGRSRGVFNGRIRIREGAAQTAAEQVNQNLLLSDAALVNTNPQLEIHADDVTCRHGATIGQLDEDRMFYLRSRGLAEASARRLLVNAFADEVLDRIEPASLRDALVARLASESFRDV